MIDFTIETHIGRPAGEVFDYVTDPDRLATWQTSTVSAAKEGGGPVGLGTRMREVHRGPRGREVEQVVEVSEWEPGRTFALRIVEGPLPIHLRVTLEEVDGGTLMRFRPHGQPRGAMRIAQPLLRRVLRRQFTRDCERLAEVLAPAA